MLSACVHSGPKASYPYRTLAGCTSAACALRAFSNYAGVSCLAGMGRRPLTLVPPPGAVPSSSEPCSAAMRSVMFWMPDPRRTRHKASDPHHGTNLPGRPGRPDHAE